MLSFEPELHVYRWNGAIVPSVTQILAPVVDYSRIPTYVLEHAAERGSAAHMATELDDLGDLDESSVSIEIWPYLEAWRRFRRDSGFRATRVEPRLYHEGLRFAGTPDRIGHMNGVAGLALVEVKTTSQAAPWHALQTSGYRTLLDGHIGDETITRRLVVYLRPDASYRTVECRDPDDVTVFLSLLNLHHWRSKHDPASR